jgi:hypothetical protein
MFMMEGKGVWQATLRVLWTSLLPVAARILTAKSVVLSERATCPTQTVPLPPSPSFASLSVIAVGDIMMMPACFSSTQAALIDSTTAAHFSSVGASLLAFAAGRATSLVVGNGGFFTIA